MALLAWSQMIGPPGSSILTATTCRAVGLHLLDSVMERHAKLSLMHSSNQQGVASIRKRESIASSEVDSKKEMARKEKERRLRRTLEGPSPPSRVELRKLDLLGLGSSSNASPARAAVISDCPSIPALLALYHFLDTICLRKSHTRPRTPHIIDAITALLSARVRVAPP